MGRQAVAWSEVLAGKRPWRRWLGALLIMLVTGSAVPGGPIAAAVNPGLRSGAVAQLDVTPFGNLNASTYNDNAFVLTNQSTAGQQLTRLTLDLRTAILPDVVFDPDGKAGDQVAKAFSPNNGTAAVGYRNHQLHSFHNGTNDDDGFDQLTVNFNDFTAGESFGFSIDIDPTTIKGVLAPGPGESGSVSGLELTGATVTVGFSDGTTLTAPLFHQANSDSGATIKLRSGAPSAPTITIPGVSAPTTLFAAAQTISVSAPAGSTVRLFQMEGALFEQSGGGYDVDPFEANSAIAWRESSATVTANGQVAIPVTLTKSDGDGGINHFVAAVTDANGAGLISNRLVIAYDPTGTPPTATPTSTPSPTPTPTGTATLTPNSTSTSTIIPTVTETPTNTPTPTVTSTATLQPTPTPNVTPHPTVRADNHAFLLPIFR